MTTNRRGFLAGFVGLGAVLVVGCGSGDDEDPNKIIIGGEETITPVIATSELVVGENRFVIGVLDREQQPIVDARVKFTFFELTASGQALERSAMDAVSRVPARDAGLTEEVVHIHSDGNRHTHINAGTDVGVYTAIVGFDKAGDWGVEIAVEAKEPKVKESVRVRFNVIDQAITPRVGSAAPRTVNLTAKDVADIAEIDSSASPEPAFHETTIAAAIAAGRPALVLFAVPGFCDSRLCGPEYEIMKKLRPKYQGRAEFIHVEFYKNPGSPERVVADAVREWNLRSEPWFFVIDSKGIIAAKFEGPAALSELDEALTKAL